VGEGTTTLLKRKRERVDLLSRGKTVKRGTTASFLGKGRAGLALRQHQVERGWAPRSFAWRGKREQGSERLGASCNDGRGRGNFPTTLKIAEAFCPSAKEGQREGGDEWGVTDAGREGNKPGRVAKRGRPGKKTVKVSLSQERRQGGGSGCLLEGRRPTRPLSRG